jgi:hypothetical protein
LEFQDAINQYDQEGKPTDEEYSGKLDFSLL